jgi:hypothetical protein
MTIAVTLAMFVESKVALNDTMNSVENAVQIQGPKATANVVVFIYNGCNITLLDSGLASEIGLNGERVPLCCNWTAGISRYNDQNIKKSLQKFQRTSNHNLFT